MNCLSDTCFAKLGDLPLQYIHVLSVHSMTSHDLCPMGVVQCTVMLGHTQVMHIFIVCKNWQKEHLIGLDLQQFHHLGCDWMKSG